VKIIFDLVNCGLGNNGGSYTIVASANTLARLGHNVTIIDSGMNKHTWESLYDNVKHIIIKQDSDVPNADVIIATGYRTVRHVVGLPPRCGLKIHWIRGWETWNFFEDQIVSNVLKAPTIKVVNSICLQKKLKQYGFDSHIIRPGYDSFTYFPLEWEGRREHNSFIIGGLYNEGKKRQGKRTEWIFKCFEKLKKEDQSVQLVMFGSEGKPSNVTYYRQEPVPTLKNQIYNMCHLWLAPTELEGLHIPPAEAMLTNCPVLGTNAEMSGMEDYLINGFNGMISQNDFDSFYSALLSYFKIWKANKLVSIFEENPRSKILELGTRLENMQLFINLLKELGIQNA
jgi:glycosyltransferase involved in cell wall biosynthesis